MQTLWEEATPTLFRLLSPTPSPTHTNGHRTKPPLNFVNVKITARMDASSCAPRYSPYKNPHLSRSLCTVHVDNFLGPRMRQRALNFVLSSRAYKVHIFWF